MPNRFTRIPNGQPPPLPRLVDLVVPIADVFMIAMVSRPATGSLRRTWVTPATLWLTAATAATMALALGIDLVYADGGLRIAAAIVGALTLAGSLAVTVVAVAQRRRRDTPA